jgi:hypothetical protein
VRRVSRMPPKHAEEPSPSQRNKPCGVEAEVRAWTATYAGPDTGKVVVTLEFE